MKKRLVALVSAFLMTVAMLTMTNPPAQASTTECYTTVGGLQCGWRDINASGQLNYLGSAFGKNLYGWVDVNWSPWDSVSSLLNNTYQVSENFTGANATGLKLIVAPREYIPDLRYTSSGDFNDKLKVVRYFYDKR